MASYTQEEGDTTVAAGSRQQEQELWPLFGEEYSSSNNFAKILHDRKRCLISRRREEGTTTKEREQEQERNSNKERENERAASGC